MRGDKVRRRQSTETLCCFTPTHPLCVCAANVVCLFTEWLDLAGRNVHSFPFLLRLLMCLSLWFFSIHVSLFFISLSLPICPSVYVSFFSLVLPLETPDLTLKVFWLITLGIFPLRLNALPQQRALPRSLRAAQERVTLIIPVIGFSNAEAVIYMRWHSVQTCRPSQPFSGKQLTAPLSRLPPSRTLFSLATPLPLSLPLAIVFTQTEKIYCQKSEGCARRWNC